MQLHVSTREVAASQTDILVTDELISIFKTVILCFFLELRLNFHKPHHELPTKKKREKKKAAGNRSGHRRKHTVKTITEAAPAFVSGETAETHFCRASSSRRYSPCGVLPVTSSSYFQRLPWICSRRVEPIQQAAQKPVLYIIITFVLLHCGRAPSIKHFHFILFYVFFFFIFTEKADERLL